MSFTVDLSRGWPTGRYFRTRRPEDPHQFDVTFLCPRCANFSAFVPGEHVDRAMRRKRTDFRARCIVCPDLVKLRQEATRITEAPDTPTSPQRLDHDADKDDTDASSMSASASASSAPE